MRWSFVVKKNRSGALIWKVAQSGSSGSMKMMTERPYVDPEKAARRLMQHAHAFEIVQDGRIYIEKLNAPFLYIDKATPAEYSAGLAYAIEHCWLTIHESGTFVRLTQNGADLFA